MNLFMIIIHIIEILLWIFVAASVLYITFFALVSLFPNNKHERFRTENINKEKPRFLMLFPAYKEDLVILNSINSFLQQDYDKYSYDICVIADHMQEATNTSLKSLPINVLIPQFDNSSKAKALKFAIANNATNYDYVVILDADNVVDHDYLTNLALLLSENDYTAIQCHRCAKNNDNNIAELDGISEEINNSIFRKAHNRIGLSSALIGSGMCFKYSWFANNVNHLSTAGEDRELEALLIRQSKYIKYADNIHVFDEKVSSQENFQRQRLRWLTVQIQCLLSMLPYIPQAIKTGNINYIDKTIQQALIPRSILIAITLLMSIVVLFINPVWSIKWWMLFLCVVCAIIIATPSRLRTTNIICNSCILPKLIFRMCCNILHIDISNKDFLHTTHDK